MLFPGVQRPQIQILRADGSVSPPFELKMLINETHESTDETTDHPVENGSDITDHIRQTPDRVTLDIFVTNEPVDQSGEDAVRTAIPFVLPGPSPQIVVAPGTGSVTVPATDNQAFIFTPGGAFSRLTSLLPGQGQQPFAATVDVFPTPKDYVYQQLVELETLRGQLLSLVTSKKNYSNMVLLGVTMRRGPGDGTGATLTLSFKSIRIVNTEIVAAPILAAPGAKTSVNKGAQSAPPAAAKIPESILHAL